MRLRRSDPAKPGYRRLRCGRGFRYCDLGGGALADRADLARIRSLAIPPAWRDVWICPDDRGHLQAVGTDSAGRRQYLYHDEWRRQRDAAKFDSMLAVARRLPAVREQVTADLARRGLVRARVLAATVRLLDRGAFRVGNDEYAASDEATYGVATLLGKHAAVRGDVMTFCYPAKGAVQRRLTVSDADTARVVSALRRRGEPEAPLFVFRSGRGWRPVHSDDINDYLRSAAGLAITAKDFRTWHATVLAATLLAATPPARSRTARERAVRETMREVADFLGNTATVARASYVDPRVVDRYREGRTVARALARLGPEFDPADAAQHAALERAVLRLLR